MKNQEVYNQLSLYTLTHPDPYFIHQLIVDAHTAQTATPETKPIAITFALVGLYLVLEHNFTGRQAQNAHVKLTQGPKKWPHFELPEFRGNLTINHALKAEPGPQRDKAIREWCQAVWDTYADQASQIHKLLVIRNILNK